MIKTPNRKRQTATITLQGDPDVVFALMCPVAEYDWVPGWKTKQILSHSGLVEEDCVFVTPTDGDDATWIVSHHDKTARELTMYKLVPNFAVTRLDIKISPVEAGSLATISYEHTALGKSGKALVDNHTTKNYAATMEGWQHNINQYLAA